MVFRRLWDIFQFRLVLVTRFIVFLHTHVQIQHRIFNRNIFKYNKIVVALLENVLYVWTSLTYHVHLP